MDNMTEREKMILADKLRFIFMILAFLTTLIAGGVIGWFIKALS